MAERILPRSSTSSSKVSAALTSTWSRKPPISPARTMDTYRRLKVLGCRARAADSEVPFSTSARTWTITSPRRRLLVCSPRMVRAPQQRQAGVDHGGELAREHGQVLELDPAGAGQADLGLEAGALLGLDGDGASPSARSRLTTAASLSASMAPTAILPSRSRTL